MKPFFFLGTLFSVLLVNPVAKAQESTPVTPNTGTPIQIDRSQPIQQSGTVLDSNSSSRQFFQEGRDKLYFLPEEKSEPILEIEEEEAPANATQMETESDLESE